MTKKMLGVVCAAVLALSLGACGGGEKESTPEETPVQQERQAEEPESEPAEEPEPEPETAISWRHTPTRAPLILLR